MLLSRCFIFSTVALIGLQTFADDGKLALIAVPTPTPSEAEELAAIRTLPRSKMYDALNLLSSEKRKRFAVLLRNFNPDLTYNEIRARRLEEVDIDWHTLIALGDPVTGKYLAKEVLRDTSIRYSEPWERLYQWRSTQLIAELGSILENNEPIWGRNLEITDTNIEPKARAFSSHFPENILYAVSETPRYMGGTVSAAPYFPELPHTTKASLKAFYLEWKEVREEMERKGRHDLSYSQDEAFTESYSAIRQTMKAWWIANKESFLAGKYAEVKPLDEATTIHPARTSPTPLKSATPPPAVPTAAVISSVPEPAPKPSRNFVVLATVSAVLALLVLLFRYRLSRKNLRMP